MEVNSLPLPLKLFLVIESKSGSSKRGSCFFLDDILELLV